MKYFFGLIIFLSTWTKSISQEHFLKIDSAWVDLKIQIQRRADIGRSIAKLLSNNTKIDKKILQKTKVLADNLSKFIDTLRDKSKAALTMVASKNNNLTKSINRTLLLYQDHPKFKQGEEILDLQMSLEGCENRLIVAKNKYNSICRQVGRSDLCFDIASN
jgi:LemA protein